MPCLVETVNWFLGRFRECIFVISSYVPFEMDLTLNLNKIETPRSNEGLVDIGSEIMRRRVKSSLHA